VSPELSAHVERVHRDSGIDVRTGIAVGGFEVQGDRLVALEAGGESLALDALLLGIGAEPEHTLASACGIDCDNGIVVDKHMRTSDPQVLAIGDCTNFPEPTSGRRLRLESVQNASDQAKAAATTILGTPQPYQALPWFWSEQGSMRLQMAGLMPPDGERYLRPGATPASFSVLHYAGGRLACVESINLPLDHIAARKLLELGRSPDPAAASDLAVPLKRFTL
jgi:3-phenylpropionate/trans-cinnamate dioxygenase ferredoxin reductase component